MIIILLCSLCHSGRRLNKYTCNKGFFEKNLIVTLSVWKVKSMSSYLPHLSSKEGLLQYIPLQLLLRPPPAPPSQTCCSTQTLRLK